MNHGNGKLPGEVTPRRAARLLGVHSETIYRWCHDAIDGRQSKLTGVRKSITGRFFIRRETIEAMIAEHTASQK